MRRGESLHSAISCPATRRRQKAPTNMLSSDSHIVDTAGSVVESARSGVPGARSTRRQSTAGMVVIDGRQTMSFSRIQNRRPIRQGWHGAETRPFRRVGGARTNHERMTRRSAMGVGSVRIRAKDDGIWHPGSALCSATMERLQRRPGRISQRDRLAKGVFSRHWSISRRPPDDREMTRAVTSGRRVRITVRPAREATTIRVRAVRVAARSRDPVAMTCHRKYRASPDQFRRDPQRGRQPVYAGRAVPQIDRRIIIAASSNHPTAQDRSTRSVRIQYIWQMDYCHTDGRHAHTASV